MNENRPAWFRDTWNNKICNHEWAEKIFADAEYEHLIIEYHCKHCHIITDEYQEVSQVHRCIRGI